MKMVQCEKGHFYDQEKSLSCPYCNQTDDSERTVILGMNEGEERRDSHPSYGGGIEKTVAVFPGRDEGWNLSSDDIGKTVAVIPERSPGGYEEDDNRTVAIFKKTKDFKVDPVVGWLIALNGKYKGKDYKVHSDNNFIGRDQSMDICIEGDETISRERHAVISFDNRRKEFYFSPSEGRAIVRVNEMPIYNTVKLEDFDEIEIGETMLLFRSLCGDSFSWED